MRDSTFFINYKKSGDVVFSCEHMENDRYMVAFWGETFSLVDREGHEYDSFKCHDVKTFLALMHDHEYETVYDMNGAFVAAVYDKSTRVLSIINDRFGILPVYVASDRDGGWYFTSDIRDLQGEIELYPDYVGISEYLSFGYCLEERTFFKNIKYMLPGQEIIISQGKYNDRIYYVLPSVQETSSKSRATYIDELENLFRHAIEIRRADENVIGLTGGFDSRLILAILGGESTHTYNFGNYGSGDEVGASALANIYRTDHHYLSFGDINAVEAAREIIARCGGQCPWERFYILNSAKEKAKIIGGVEISGMGGDAVSGQKSNFTGLFPHMGKEMSESAYRHERDRLICDTTRGRISASDESCYGRQITESVNEVKGDLNRAIKNAQSGFTFGNYTMRLKLRTMERRVTASSMWLTGQFLPIRFPVYDYAVMCYFNRLPQKYRYGQNLYIDYIARKYPKAALAPHSETGYKVDCGHVLRTDYITVRDYAIRKFFGKKPAYTDSFGFVNDKIRTCTDLRGLICDEKLSSDGIFDISAYGNVDGLIEVALRKGGKAMIHLKNIIQFSLINEIFCDNRMNIFYKKF